MVAVWIIVLLAVVQGILEWLPVSSEGQLVLILNWLNESENALAITLFLHLGTLIAIIIRFRKDLGLLFGIKRQEKDSKGDKDPEVETSDDEKEREEKGQSKEEQKVLWKFLLLGTLFTGIIGVPLYFLVKYVLQEGELLTFANGAITGGDIITMLIGIFLVGTGIFIFISKRRLSVRSLLQMKTWEMIIVGLVQGLAIIPGVSRSGSTVSAMLLEGIQEEESLRLSFLLSIPAVIGANILTIIIDLAKGEMSFTGIPIYGMFLAIFIAAIVGYLTIDLFLRFAKKVNFGWFCVAMGALALVITIIIITLRATTVI
ncbi:MAG: undecaprenyl-diphosphate phosphatase [Candidatus Heimdallarchaeota archaeon]|nr:undecaprenyl-diphosphate phosphatase [Candidatus Heimdallarchaeota archaeon]